MRKIFPILLLACTGLLFIIRLVFLQFVNHEEYDEISINQSSKAKYDYPQRGYIYDRNGKLLAGNQPSYDVMLVPSDLEEFDTLEFARLLNLEKKALVSNNKVSNKSRRQNSSKSKSIFFLFSLTKKLKQK